MREGVAAGRGGGVGAVTRDTYHTLLNDVSNNNPFYLVIYMK